MTYLEEITEAEERYTTYELANKLIERLGKEKVEEIFDELFIVMAGQTAVNKAPNLSLYDGKATLDEYNIYWVARKLIEMNGNDPKEDGITYPNHGWVNGELFPELLKISEQLNRLRGVHCDPGVIYPHGTWAGTKGLWRLVFDTIEDFNHFLWASCFRYLPIFKCDKWRIFPELGDPSYNNKKLCFELHYNVLNTDKETLLKDIEEFAEGAKEYADQEEEIRKELSK